MSNNVLQSIKATSFDNVLDALEKQFGYKCFESILKGVGYAYSDTGWAVIDIQKKSIITGDWDVMPTMIEELKGLYEQYSGMVT